MSEYERILNEHDPQIYKAVLPYIPDVPDFRPQETIRRMRGTYLNEEFIPEPQNNWRALVEELDALDYNEHHLTLLNAINSGDEKQIEPYIEEKRNIVSDFFFSYPVLTWLMSKVSSKETIIPLFVSQGEELEEPFKSYLYQEIPLEPKDLLYIRDKTTAENLYKRDPYLVPHTRDIFFHWIREGEIGPILWLLQDKQFYPEKGVIEAAKYNRVEILQLLLDNHRVNDITNGNALLEAVYRGNIRIVEMLLKDGRVDVSIYNNLPLREAMRRRYYDIAYLLLQNPNVDPSAKDNEALLLAIKRIEGGLLESLLNDERININQTDIENIKKIIYGGSYGSYYPQPEQLYEKFIYPILRTHPKTRNLLI